MIISSRTSHFLLRPTASSFRHHHAGKSPSSSDQASKFQPPETPLHHFRKLVGDDKSQFNHQLRLRCNAVSKPRIQEYRELFQNGLPVIKWRENIVDDDDKEEDALEIFHDAIKIKDHIESIKLMLSSMEDGEISISAYDTAWVALIEDANNSGVPHFPSCLQWIVNNQLPDGSWGDPFIFDVHDRILNTLGCVITLKSWNVHHHKCTKGVAFIRSNMNKLENEDPEHMPIGFEVAFPSLLETARNLEIDIPYDAPFLQEINARRDLKLTKIPKEILHIMPTTLLHSLEGMGGLDWEKLIKLKCSDGSFLFSPSSTAYAVMQTRDDNCLNYLKKAVERFDGGVPNVYPVDLFEHMWAIDRLQRLGISRHFQAEIKNCISYIRRYWTEKGICWARNSQVQDIDDTAMGFRLLRLHGYDVSPDVFKHFKKAEGFVCFAGQSTQAVTGMYNLFRASQVQFPGESVLDEARKFSCNFLKEKQACGELLDKWIITKDLPGEVGYALDVPWYGSLPRIESRVYIEQYGGADDVWIGKTLYRMPNVNNETYLELAKLDYNKCQTVHQLELDGIQKWYIESKLADFGIGKRTVLLSYFVAAASIYEPERSKMRLAWAKTSIIVNTITSYFESNKISSKQRSAFVEKFMEGASSGENLGLKNGGSCRHTDSSLTSSLVSILLKTLNQISLDALLAHGNDTRQHLVDVWKFWLHSMYEEEGDDDVDSREGELLVKTINLAGGCLGPEELSSLLQHPQYTALSALTNRLCRRLRQSQNHRKQQEEEDINGDSCYLEESMLTKNQIESDMQELVYAVLRRNSEEDIDSDVKQIFLMVAKSFYYLAHCNPAKVNFHIAEVLFERV